MEKKPSVMLASLLLLLLVVFVTALCGRQDKSGVQLPKAAAQAILKQVPGGKILKVKKETENGKELFEVLVQSADKYYEFDVTADGTILDKETKTIEAEEEEENEAEEREAIESEASEETEAEEREEQEHEVVFTFDENPAGQLPAGWSNQKTGKGTLGKWAVLVDSTAPSKPHVLAQTSKENFGYHFNLAVVENSNYSDLEIELKFKAVDGQEDQGGGPVWRYQDANNYYICRANPLESNFRVYKVINGNRKQLQSANVEIPAHVWHSLKITNQGNHIQCWYDGKLYLDVTDNTFKSGKVGLWSKADAVTYFDNFEIEEKD